MKRNRKINLADTASHKRPRPRMKGKIEEESEASRKDWDRYFNDVEESECFEVGDYPHIDLSRVTGDPLVRRIYDSSHTDENLQDDMLLYLSKLAICFYNFREATHFGHVKLVMATRSGIKLEDHYITFQASSSTKGERVTVTFQTYILVDFVSPYPKFEIMFVRIKPSEFYQIKSKIYSQRGQLSESDHDKDQIHQQSFLQVIEKYTMGSRWKSQYGLAHYLSQYALFSYYFFTLSKRVAKHDIKSLKVVKLVKPHTEVLTYHITYEAPLRGKTKRKNVDTFKTEICLPSVFPTTVIEFKSEEQVITGNKFN